jgi:3-hydroxyisobutyrate dehydrogenase-like beta-hydroxyacid dehydrogenase
MLGLRYEIVRVGGASSHTQAIVMDVGFIGLGNLGIAMLRCLLKASHRLTIYNRSERPADVCHGEAMGTEDFGHRRKLA